MTGTFVKNSLPAVKPIFLSFKRMWLRTVSSKSFMADHKYGHIRERKKENNHSLSRYLAYTKASNV